MCSPHATSNSIFWGHGTADPLSQFSLCKESVDYLKNTLGLPEASDTPETTSSKGLTFKPYAGLEHEVGPQELYDLAAWLKKTLPMQSHSQPSGEALDGGEENGQGQGQDRSIVGIYSRNAT